MATELAIFQAKDITVPEYLGGVPASNMDQGGTGSPSLTVRGKVFRINVDGVEQVIQQHDPAVGESVPVQALSVIVIDQGPYGSRVYYASKYDPESPAGPACYSLDGKLPSPDIAEPQAQSCATCPHAVKGSRLTLSGLPTTACQLQRRLAVVPAATPDFPALLLRLSPTSAFDKATKGSESGWFAWRQYVEFIASRGVKHTAQVVTKIRFDPTAETPKLLFRPERFLTPEEAAIILPRVNSEEVRKMLHPPAGGAHVVTAVANHAPQALPAATIANPVSQAAPAVAAPKQASPQPAVDAESDDVTPKKPARRTVSAAAPTKAAPAADISQLLDSWAE